MKPFHFAFPGRVLFAPGGVEKLGDFAREAEAKSAFIVTDPGIVQAQIAGRALDSLHSAGLAAHLFEEVEENPTTLHVEKGTKEAQKARPDLIVGLGGGSAMDCAKGINFLLTNGGKMEDYWGFDKASRPMLPSIGVPTTAGTGSEAQSFAVIEQASTGQKMACGDTKARFGTVILDPRLTRTTPKEVAAAAGMDAMAHAIESYVCTKRNLVSQMFAREAYRILEANYEQHLRDQDVPGPAEQMLMGAHLAGAAIETSMLGAAHACANPLTAQFGMRHGTAVGIMLPHVIRFNATSDASLYDRLSQPGDSPEGLASRVEQLGRSAGLVSGLLDLGIDRRDIPILARAATSQWTGQFNPRPVAESDFVALYEAAIC